MHTELSKGVFRAFKRRIQWTLSFFCLLFFRTQFVWIKRENERVDEKRFNGRNHKWTNITIAEENWNHWSDEKEAGNKLQAKQFPVMLVAREQCRRSQHLPVRARAGTVVRQLKRRGWGPPPQDSTPNLPHQRRVHIRQRFLPSGKFDADIRMWR